MEKTITIDGKQVNFKSTAATPMRYKAQFGKDFFSDILKLYPLAKMDLENIEDDTEKMQKVLELMDFDMLYNMIWTLAKTANNKIPDPLTWLDGFDEFPLMDIFPEIQEMLLKNLMSKKK